jgi:hypothetical protein
MASRVKLSTKKDRKGKTDDEHKVEDDEEKKIQGGKKGKGWNWSAVFLLCIMVLLPVCIAILNLIDILYPEAAATRRIRDKVIACYEVANPEKVSNIDEVMNKYKGKESLLVYRLAEKYGKYEECVIGKV